MIKLMTKRAIIGPERKPFKIPSIHIVHAQIHSPSIKSIFPQSFLGLKLMGASLSLGLDKKVSKPIRLGLHTISLGFARPGLSVPVIPTKRK